MFSGSFIFPSVLDARLIFEGSHELMKIHGFNLNDVDRKITLNGSRDCLVSPSHDG